MATENLQIKLTVDTSQVQSSVQKMKKQMADVGAPGQEASAKATKKTAEATKELTKELKGIKGLGAFALIASAAKNAAGEIAGMFNFKEFLANAGEGENKFKVIFESMKIQAGEAGKSLSQAFGGIKAAAVGVLAVITAIVVAMVAWVKAALRVSATTKQLAADAAKLGLTTKEYQEWGYVLETVGVQADELGSFIKTLSDEQAQIREGAEGASKAFEALGLSVEQVSNMSQKQLFTETVKRLQDVDNAVERTALAYQIFGEDAAHLANVMNMSSAETAQLIRNFNELGGGATPNLTRKSLELQMAVGHLKNAWTGMVNALAEYVMPAISAVINWLAKGIAIIGLFLRAVFGLSSGKSKSSTSGMTAGMNSYTKATNAATKAAEKLKRTQMGFDELNVVDDPNKGSGSGSGDTGGFGAGGGGINPDLGMDFKIPKIDLSGPREFIEKHKTLIQDITTIALTIGGLILAIAMFYTGNIAGGIAGLALMGLGIGVGFAEGGSFDRWGKGLSDFFAKVKGWLKDFVDWVSPFFQAIGDFFTNVATVLWAGITTIATSIKDFFVAIWTEIVSMAEAVWGAITAIWAHLQPFFEPIWAGVVAIFSTAWELIKGIALTVWEVIKGAFNIVVSVLKIGFEAIKLVAIVVWEAIKTVFVLAWEAIKVVWSVVVSFFKGIWDSIKLIFNVVEEFFRGNFEGAWEAIKKLVGTWGQFFVGIWDSIKKAFSNVKSFFKDSFSGAWEAIKKVFSNFGTFFKGLWDNIVGIFKNVGTTIGSAISNTVKTAINGVLSTAVSIINTFLKAINSAITVINAIPGVNIKKLKTLTVPKLAKGGVIDGATLAMIGERGKEAVVPLENNTEWMDKLADRLATRNQSPSKIYLMLDGKQLGQATIKSINDITSQTGELPLVIA